MKRSKKKKIVIKTTVGDLVVALTDASRKGSGSESESLKLASLAVNDLLERRTDSK